MISEIVTSDVQSVDVKRVSEGIGNEYTIGQRTEESDGRKILIITAKALPNKRYFRTENLTLSLEEVEKAKILQIPNTGMIEELCWQMEDEQGELYCFHQLVVVEENLERKILAEGTWRFCCDCQQQLQKLFVERREKEYRGEIEKLLKGAEGLTIYGRLEEEKITELLNRARKLAEWDVFSKYERWVRREAGRISSSIRVGDTVTASLVSFKVQ